LDLPTLTAVADWLEEARSMPESTDRGVLLWLLVRMQAAAHGLAQQSPGGG
jgi:hypothetical protein